MPSINSCSTIAEIAELKVSLLESIAASVSGSVASLSDDIDSFDPLDISPAQDMTDAAQTDITDTLGLGSDLQDDLENFSGNCLNDLSTSLNNFDITEGVDEVFAGASSPFAGLGEELLGSALSGLTSLLAGYGLEKLIGTIDQKIECLTNSGIGDCIANATDFQNRVDYIIDLLKLNDTGEFDLESMTDAILGVPQALLDNVQVMSDGMTTMMQSAADSVQSTMDAVGALCPPAPFPLEIEIPIPVLKLPSFSLPSFSGLSLPSMPKLPKPLKLPSCDSLADWPSAMGTLFEVTTAEVEIF